MQRLQGKNTAAIGGFTLIELMVALAVMAVILTLAVPSFTSMIARNRLAAASNELVAGLQIARTESVRRNARVLLCPSTDDATCTGDDWSHVIVFHDANSDSDATAGEEIIRSIQITNGLTVNPSANVATNQRIGFGADGFARVGDAGAREGAISVCSTKVAEAENTRDVRLGVSRINVERRDGTADCTALAN
ncbi:GspH/FimT family pseudopilin [Lysobacter panacisoli]|uniref:Type II secretion system protein H n=1 Tax=Lysobacter panacisoli TaxID=1255263 RepID=A0ABP9LG39_9GAMM|nr:GspH/FimT family pseudopilin [Lysobacter panacisoli]